MKNHNTRFLFVALTVLSLGTLSVPGYAQIIVPASECPISATLPHDCWYDDTGNWMCTREDLSIVKISSGTKTQMYGESEWLSNCDGCPETKPSTRRFDTTLSVDYTEPTPMVTLARDPMEEANRVITTLENSIGHSTQRSLSSNSKEFRASVLGCEMRLITAVLDVYVNVVKRMPHEYVLKHSNVKHGALVWQPPPANPLICRRCGEDFQTFPRTFSTPPSKVHSTVTGDEYVSPIYSTIGPCGIPCY